MLTNNVNTLFFDMDGLLVDTESVYRDGWLYAFQKSKLDISPSVVNAWLGKSMYDTKAYILNVCGSEKLYENIRNDRETYIYKCLYDGTLQAKPFAKETLKSAKELGYTTGLATSTSKKRSIDILTTLKLLEYLDFPVYADDVARLKPYPDIYLEAIRRTKCNIKQVIAIEDSLTGAKAAHAAGIQTILIPDKTFNEIQEKVESIILYGKDLSVVGTWMNRVGNR